MSTQARIAVWVRKTFGEVVAADATERALRAAEEVIELAQACTIDAATLHRLVDYVFSRPEGNAAKEIGGCMITLYAASEALGVDADERLEAELLRIQDPEIIERCRRRQSEKREALSPPRPGPLPNVEVLGQPRSAQRWTAIGLYERGKYIRDVFVCYIGGLSAVEAKDEAVRVNSERGDKIEVLACVAGGGVAHVFEPEVPTRPRTATGASLRHDAALGKNAIRAQRDALWMLLDDIDTLDDSARGHDNVFRDKARAIQKKRWAIHNPDAPGEDPVIDEQRNASR